MSTSEWKQVKGKIKAKFGKLSDDDIDGLHGHMDRLQAKVKKAYAYSEDKAKSECEAFNKSIKQA
jgi:uncharacterized protein YjbJ (UPF0337 family)